MHPPTCKPNHTPIQKHTQIQKMYVSVTYAYGFWHFCCVEPTWLGPLPPLSGARIFFHLVPFCGGLFWAGTSPFAVVGGVSVSDVLSSWVRTGFVKVTVLDCIE